MGNKNGLALEAWRMPIYRTHLKQAGIKYQRFKLPDSNKFYFKFSDGPEVVGPVLKSAFDECERLKNKYCGKRVNEIKN